MPAEIMAIMMWLHSMGMPMPMMPMSPMMPNMPGK